MAFLDDVGSYLVAQGVVKGATGWALSLGVVPPDPDRVVTLFETEGEEAEETDGAKYNFPGLQVQVRAEEWGYEVARSKIGAAFTALQDATISGFIYVFSSGSGPIPLGQDTNERPVLSWNFRTMTER